MEIGEFHHRNGWYFARLEDGGVRIRFSREEPSGRDVVHIITPNEWASIVSHVSKWGESGDSYQSALTFHGDPASRSSLPGAPSDTLDAEEARAVLDYLNAVIEVDIAYDLYYERAFVKLHRIASGGEKS